MNKNLVIAIVLGILIVISVIQVVQLSALKENLAAGGATSFPSSGASGGPIASPSAPSGSPAMVGGC